MKPVVCKDRPSWLKERSKSIGASDEPTIMGVSAYKGATHLKLYQDKVEPQTDDDKPEWMEWGNLLEPVIAKKFCDETGHELIDPGQFTIYRHDATPFMHATPDYLLEEEVDDMGQGVLQIKAPGSHFSSDWIEGPPIGVEIQVQAEMHSCGCQWGAVAALIGGQSFRYAMALRNQPFIDKMIEMTREFWNDHIVSRKPPAAVAADIELLGRMFPDHKKGVTIECTEEMVLHADEHDRLKEEIKLASGAKDYHEAKIKQFMQHAEAMLLEDGSSFTWKQMKKKEFTVKAHTERPFRRKAAPKK